MTIDKKTVIYSSIGITSLISMYITSSNSNLLKTLIYLFLLFIAQMLIIEVIKHKLEENNELIKEYKWIEEVEVLLNTNMIYIISTTIYIYIFIFIIGIIGNIFFSQYFSQYVESIYKYLLTLAILLIIAYPHRKYLTFLDEVDKDRNTDSEMVMDFELYSEVLEKADLRKIAYIVSIIITLFSDIISLNNGEVNNPMAKSVLAFIVIDSTMQTFKENKNQLIKNRKNVKRRRNIS